MRQSYWLSTLTVSTSFPVGQNKRRGARCTRNVSPSLRYVATQRKNNRNRKSRGLRPIFGACQNRKPHRINDLASTNHSDPQRRKRRQIAFLGAKTTIFHPFSRPPALEFPRFFSPPSAGPGRVIGGNASPALKWAPTMDHAAALTNHELTSPLAAGRSRGVCRDRTSLAGARRPASVATARPTRRRRRPVPGGFRPRPASPRRYQPSHAFSDPGWYRIALNVRIAAAASSVAREPFGAARRSVVAPPAADLVAHDETSAESPTTH